MITFAILPGEYSCQTENEVVELPDGFPICHNPSHGCNYKSTGIRRCNAINMIERVMERRADIEKSRLRVDRLRSDWKRNNLRNWITGAEERLDKFIAQIITDGERCTCPIAD